MDASPKSLKNANVVPKDHNLEVFKSVGMHIKLPIACLPAKIINSIDSVRLVRGYNIFGFGHTVDGIL